VAAAEQATLFALFAATARRVTARKNSSVNETSWLLTTVALFCLAANSKRHALVNQHPFRSPVRRESES
jgi:hypothetical protein